LQVKPSGVVTLDFNKLSSYGTVRTGGPGASRFWRPRGWRPTWSIRISSRLAESFWRRAGRARVHIAGRISSARKKRRFAWRGPYVIVIEVPKDSGKKPTTVGRSFIRRKAVAFAVYAWGGAQRLRNLRCAMHIGDIEIPGVRARGAPRNDTRIIRTPSPAPCGTVG